MTSSSFHYGFLGAKEAEIMLRKSGIDGCFLVRKVMNRFRKERHILTFLGKNRTGKNSFKHLLIPFNLRLKSTLIEDLEIITNRLVKSFPECMNPLKVEVKAEDNDLKVEVKAEDNDQKVDEQSYSKVFLVQTKRKEKGIPRMEQCYICELVGENAGQSDHQNNHRVCLCDLCDRYFGHKSFSTHRKRCTNSPKDLLLCNYCDYKSISKGNLKLHYKTHEDKKLFKCDKCSKVYQSEKRLTYHLGVNRCIKVYKRLKREDQKCTYAPECSYTTRRRSNFVRHLKSHSTPKRDFPTIFTCKECPYTTKIKFHFNRHSKSCKKKRAKPIIISMIEPGTLCAIDSTHN